jgi:hypothetical protein
MPSECDTISDLLTSSFSLPKILEENKKIWSPMGKELELYYDSPPLRSSSPYIYTKLNWPTHVLIVPDDNVLACMHTGFSADFGLELMLDDTSVHRPGSTWLYPTA